MNLDFSTPPSVKNPNYRFLPLSELKWRNEDSRESTLLSIEGKLPTGVSLKREKEVPAQSEFLGAWMEANIQEASVLTIGNKIDAPVHLRLRSEKNSKFSKTLVRLAAHAHAQVILEIESVEPGFLGHVLELQPGEGSVLELFLFQNLLQSTQFALSERVVLAANAHLKIHSIHAGADKGRHYFEAKTGGSGSRLEYRAATRVEGQQKIDFWVDVEHSVPHTSSELEYFTIASEKAQVNFNGSVRILPTAPFTEAFQKNKNLILSDAAHIESAPKLEIAVDEVKCAHGSSTSTVNEDQLMYLMSRGITRSESRKMIVEGWTEPLIAKFPSEDLKERIRKVLAGKTV